MKIYIATSYTNKYAGQTFAEELIAEGHIVTATWLTRVEKEELATEDDKRQYARRDLADIDEADALIVLTRNLDRVTSGMWVEFGYAWAKDKAVFICGPHKNIFSHLALQWIPN